MRKRKTTSGKFLPARRVWLAALAGLLLAVGAAPGARAAKKPKAVEQFGVVAGSVFRETGFSFAGVEVVVVWNVDGKKKKEWKARTDSRGEFAFRVPAAVGKYTVHVKADGHLPEERELEVGIDERKELSIQMRTETVKK